ncbi:alpha/beta fold hydrolase [Actinokineospora sp. UTMC 2448]|uniref:alpha/beta fold hydrolase n=1 Tax=Actinokineospora sp. UTMC 2448 TaxID=2268449 RepID=UPI002164E8C9|nr:alpha/beta hydrolase [Actinokineospora sp. UTMC 2448]UVS80193.1 Putative aminoacrylate hydrolase RutD [Actinokineospora sp. UTMC 2448]
MEELHVDRGGDGPALLLLHGLGGSSAAWSGVIDRWPGSWLAPDLPGHGGSVPLPRYSFGALAAAVARIVDGPVAVLGHSLGGVVGLALASGWFGVPVTAVCALGVKVSWSASDLAKAADLAARPARVFATREEALDRARKVAGLPEGAPTDRLVTEADGGWRLALDPAAFAVGRPDLPGLLAAARCPVTLAAGSDDPMSPAAHLETLVPDPVLLPGLGHSAHVEDPAALDALLARLR